MISWFVRTRVAEAFGVTMLAVLLTIALTYPLAFRFDHVGRVDSGDGQLSIWNVAWVARTLIVDPRHVYDANIFFPHRRTLAYSENNLGAGVLAIPAYWITKNAFAAHNSVFLLSFVLSFAAMYALAKHLTGNRLASLVAATMFAYCPYIFARTAHIQLMMTAGLPLSLHALHRLVDRRTPGRTLCLALALAGQALSSGYYGIFAGLMVGLGIVFYAVARGLWRDRAYRLGVISAAALAVVIVWPFFLPYVELRAETGFARTLEDAIMWSADWRAYFVSAAHAHAWMLPLLGHWNEVLFPGYSATLLGLAGIWLAFRQQSRAPAGSRDAQHISPPLRETAFFYTLVGGLALWLSFGPLAGLYTVLFHTLPLFSFMRAPARFGILVTLALSVLAAIALELLSRRTSPSRATTLTVITAAVVTGELVVAPLNFRERPPVDQAYRWLAQLPRGPVVEYPFFSIRSDFHRHTLYMLNSTYHWQPLVNGYSDHIPSDFREAAPKFSPFASDESFRLLRNRRVRYVVFHLNLYDRRSRNRLIARLADNHRYLRPIVQEDEVWLYEIVAWPH